MNKIENEIEEINSNFLRIVSTEKIFNIMGSANSSSTIDIHKIESDGRVNFEIYSKNFTAQAKEMIETLEKMLEFVRKEAEE